MRKAFVTLFLTTTVLVQAGLGQSPDPSKIIEKARQLARDGAADQAVQILEALIQTEPENGRAWEQLGYAHKRLGDIEKCIEAHKQAFAVRPQRYQIPAAIGWSYYQIGDYPKSIEYSREALAIKADAAYARFNLGLAYLHIGNGDAGRKEYEAALKDVDSADWLQRIAIIDLEAALEKKHQLPNGKEILLLLKEQKRRLEESGKP